MKFLAAVLVLATVPSFAQQRVIPLWPNGNPEPTKVVGPEIDPTTDKNRMVLGKPSTRVTNISKPTLTVFPAPAGKNNGAAAVVFPGGGYALLADLHEGVEVCQWLNSLGMTCLMVKYRVPEQERFPENVEDLEDAQQAMRITHEHAAEWGVDPKKIGVVGFSAGAHLAVVLGTHPDFHENAKVPMPTGVERPAFSMIVYPAYTTGQDNKISDGVKPTPGVPPTFLVQAENDLAKVESSVVYFLALKEAKIPTEMHIYAEGGHGYGLRAAPPIGGWPTLAEAWLHTIHILGPAGPVAHP